MASTNRHRTTRGKPQKAYLDPNPSFSDADVRPAEAAAGTPAAGNDACPVLSVSTQRLLSNRTSTEITALATDAEPDVVAGRPVTEHRARAARVALAELAERTCRRWPATETARKPGAISAENDTAMGWRPGHVRLEHPTALSQKTGLGLLAADHRHPAIPEGTQR